MGLDGSNNLVITDLASGGKNDSLQISSDTTNSRFVIHDPNNAIGVQVGTLADANTAHVPFASVAGGQVIVMGAGGDDTVTVDLSLGDFSKTVLFQGGTGGNDSLSLSGGGPFSEVTHTFQNASDGLVSVSGNSLISYTGLEPITDSLSADTRTFVFSSSADVVTLQPSGGPGMIISSASTSESVIFPNPTTELSIRTGDGADSITVSGLAPGFAADLTIDGEGGSDTVNLNTPSLSVDDLAVTSENIEVSMGPITSTGTQHYNGAVILQTHTTISSSGNLAFSGTVDGIGHHGESLTLNCAGMTTFTQPVGATMALANFSTDSPGSLLLPTSVTADMIFVRDQTSLSSAPTTTLTGSTWVVFVNTIDGNTAGAQSLVVNSPQTAFNTDIGVGTALGGITTDSAGTTTLNAGVINASLTCNDAVEIGQNMTLSGASIVFHGSVNSGPGESNNLNINATTTEFHGLVGQNRPLNDLITDSAGTTLLDVGTISVNRFLTFNDSVVLESDSFLVSSAMNVTFNGAVDSASGEANDLTAHAGLATQFSMAVGETSPLGSLVVQGFGQTHIVANQFHVTDAITFNLPVTISTGSFGDTAGFHASSSVTFLSTIDGTDPGVQSLTVNSLTTTFNHLIGTAVPLRNITTDAGGRTFVSSSAVVTSGGGLQEFSDDVEVLNNTTFTGDNIRFAGLLDSSGGSRDVTINASGTAEFVQNVGSVMALGSLTTDAGGSTVIGGNVTVDFMQTYNDSVVLEGDAALSAVVGGTSSSTRLSTALPVRTTA